MSRTLRITLPALLLLLTLAAACGEGDPVPETGVLRGQVTRIYSGLAVADARVEVADLVTTTDSDGRFQVNRVEQGEATIRVSAEAYRDARRSLHVTDYQSVAIELTPTDTLVTIHGLVTHRVDGPQQVRIEYPGASIWTDPEGRWSLEDAPIGPLALSIEHAGYNLFATEVLVHSEGQEFVQTLTRDTTVTWWIDNDSYVFMDSDSLNANRGHREVLRVTEELGRTAVFSLSMPEIGRPWAELVGARLTLHGRRAEVSQDDPGEARELAVGLIGLGGTFLEGAVDYFNRPAFYPLDATSLTLAVEPSNQLVEIDILPVLTATPTTFRSTGVGISAGAEQPAILLLSNDHGLGEPEILDRPQATYRLRI